MLINIEAIEAFVKQLRDAVESNDLDTAARTATKLSSRRVARALDSASTESIAGILKKTDPIKAGRIAGYLQLKKLSAVIETIPPRQGITLLSHIPPDHIGRLFRALPPEKRHKLFANVDPSKREEWQTMSDYSPETVGAAMMTGPLLTTITDITGVTIYLGLSTLFLVGLTP